MRFIDVSEWQGKIDWEQAKPFIDGAILRAGYGVNHIDAQFERNARECNRLSIPCGAYWFSYARSPEMAKQEAQHARYLHKMYQESVDEMRWVPEDAKKEWEHCVNKTMETLALVELMLTK